MKKNSKDAKKNKKVLDENKHMAKREPAALDTHSSNNTPVYEDPPFSCKKKRNGRNILRGG